MPRCPDLQWGLWFFVGTVHNGGMAATDTTTETLDEHETPSERDPRPCACHADQEALGRLLWDHPDPHVRIIAHMSNRQLAFAEQLGDLTKGLFRVAGGVSRIEERTGNISAELKNVVSAVDRLTGAVESLTEVVTTVESRLKKVEEALALGNPSSTV